MSAPCGTRPPPPGEPATGARRLGGPGPAAKFHLEHLLRESRTGRSTGEVRPAPFHRRTTELETSPSRCLRPALETCSSAARLWAVPRSRCTAGSRWLEPPAGGTPRCGTGRRSSVRRSKRTKPCRPLPSRAAPQFPRCSASSTERPSRPQEPMKTGQPRARPSRACTDERTPPLQVDVAGTPRQRRSRSGTPARPASPGWSTPWKSAKAAPPPSSRTTTQEQTTPAEGSPLALAARPAVPAARRRTARDVHRRTAVRVPHARGKADACVRSGHTRQLLRGEQLRAPTTVSSRDLGSTQMSASVAFWATDRSTACSF
mmetsp:Transcript_26535/g.48301  ORF Transcript_26535/g.48301 Transcript_26535/m.48301 type:complete len:317 (+) Transcript_26535:219-1169(+)